MTVQRLAEVHRSFLIGLLYVGHRRCRTDQSLALQLGQLEPATDYLQHIPAYGKLNTTGNSQKGAPTHEQQEPAVDHHFGYLDCWRCPHLAV
jgi:hypothetical protein